MRLWERICQDFRRGFARIHETLGEDLQGFVRLGERIRKDCKDLQGFGTLGEDLQGLNLWERILMRLWERIYKDS